MTHTPKPPSEIAKEVSLSCPTDHIILGIEYARIGFRDNPISGVGCACTKCIEKALTTERAEADKLRQEVKRLRKEVALLKQANENINRADILKGEKLSLAIEGLERMPVPSQFTRELIEKLKG